jgi:hypothetical protein
LTRPSHGEWLEKSSSCGPRTAGRNHRELLSHGDNPDNPDKPDNPEDVFGKTERASERFNADFHQKQPFGRVRKSFFIPNILVTLDHQANEE